MQQPGTVIDRYTLGNAERPGQLGGLARLLSTAIDSDKLAADQTHVLELVVLGIHQTNGHAHFHALPGQCIDFKLGALHGG